MKAIEVEGKIKKFPLSISIIQVETPMFSRRLKNEQKIGRDNGTENGISIVETMYAMGEKETPHIRQANLYRR